MWGIRSVPGLYITLFGQGMEKYVTLGWAEQLVFNDTMHFIASSLETLGSNLLSSGKDLYNSFGPPSRSTEQHTHSSTCCWVRTSSPTSSSTHVRK